MSELSSSQIEDFRADIGDENNAFAIEELQRLYTRANGNYDAAVVLAIEQLLAGSAKFNDYTEGQSKEEISQIFEHLQSLLAVKLERLSGTKSKLRFVRLKGGTYRKAEKPYNA